MATALDIDLGDVERYAKSFGASVEQIPYAMSVALNEAVNRGRTFLIENTWPRSVKVRAKGFMGASLTTRGQGATKTDLTCILYDRLGKEYINRQALGGIKASRSGGNLAIPNSRNVKRTARGVRTDQKPRNLTGKVVIGNLIFQKRGKGDRKLILMYKLQGAVRVPKRAPMYEDFIKVVGNELGQTIPEAVLKAMATARPR